MLWIILKITDAVPRIPVIALFYYLTADFHRFVPDNFFRVRHNVQIKIVILSNIKPVTTGTDDAGNEHRV